MPWLVRVPRLQLFFDVVVNTRVRQRTASALVGVPPTQEIHFTFFLPRRRKINTSFLKAKSFADLGVLSTQMTTRIADLFMRMRSPFRRGYMYHGKSGYFMYIPPRRVRVDAVS